MRADTTMHGRELLPMLIRRLSGALTMIHEEEEGKGEETKWKEGKKYEYI